MKTLFALITGILVGVFGFALMIASDQASNPDFLKDAGDAMNKMFRS